MWMIANRPTHPIVAIGEIPQLAYQKQLPLEVPDFHRLSLVKVEKYLTILSIMEENMREYAQLKDTLEKASLSYYGKVNALYQPP